MRRGLQKWYGVALLAGLLFLASPALCQAAKIPPFRMLQPNGQLFKAEELPLGKPVILIYFSPECDHCEQLMKELFKRKAEFKKASLALITYLPLTKLVKFAADYNVNGQPNIYLGTEGSSFFVRNYYKITEMPFLALYTKNGDLLKTYSRKIPLDEVSGKLKTMH